MNRLESMSVLLAVVDAGSLSAASRRLGMPLATVSRKISELEAGLKTQLLIRSTRQLTLTESGRGYIAACRRILEDVNEAERAAAGEYTEPRGELIVTAPVVFGRLHVLPVLTEFLQSYPEVKVRLALGDRNFNLVEDHVDLALRIGTLPDSGLIATRLGSLRRVACASPKYLSKRGMPERVQDLATHDCVSFELFAVGDTWRFQVNGAEATVRIHPRLTVSTAEAAIDAAVSGLGVTCVLSYQVESALRAGDLKLILESFEPAPLPVSFLYASQGRLPLKLRSLLDFATPRLRVRLQKAAAALASASLTTATKRMRSRQR
jgi:DNA-binding transcriptional LysR family regulator